MPAGSLTSDDVLARALRSPRSPHGPSHLNICSSSGSAPPLDTVPVADLSSVTSPAEALSAPTEVPEVINLAVSDVMAPAGGSTRGSDRTLSGSGRPGGAAGGARAESSASGELMGRLGGGGGGAPRGPGGGGAPPLHPPHPSGSSRSGGSGGGAAGPPRGSSPGTEDAVAAAAAAAAAAARRSRRLIPVPTSPFASARPEGKWTPPPLPSSQSVPGPTQSQRGRFSSQSADHPGTGTSLPSRSSAPRVGLQPAPPPPAGHTRSSSGSVGAGAGAGVVDLHKSTQYQHQHQHQHQPTSIRSISLSTRSGSHSTVRSDSAGESVCYPQCAYLQIELSSSIEIPLLV